MTYQWVGVERRGDYLLFVVEHAKSSLRMLVSIFN